VSHFTYRAAISRGRLLLAAGAAIAFATCTIERGDVRTPGGQPPEADTTRIRTVLEELATAYSSGDAAALRALIADEVTFFVDGVDGRGAQAAIDSLTAQRQRDGQRGLTFTGVDIELADGETAWVVCRFTLIGDRAGESVGQEGRATLILERSEGRWILVHLHLTHVTTTGAM